MSEMQARYARLELMKIMRTNGNKTFQKKCFESGTISSLNFRGNNGMDNVFDAECDSMLEGPRKRMNFSPARYHGTHTDATWNKDGTLVKNTYFSVITTDNWEYSSKQNNGYDLAAAVTSQGLQVEEKETPLASRPCPAAEVHPHQEVDEREEIQEKCVQINDLENEEHRNRDYSELVVPETIPPTPHSIFNVSESPSQIHMGNGTGFCKTDGNSRMGNSSDLHGASPFSPLFHGLDNGIKNIIFKGERTSTSGKESRYTPLGSMKHRVLFNSARKSTPDSTRFMPSGSKDKRKTIDLDSSPWLRHRILTPSKSKLMGHERREKGISNSKPDDRIMVQLSRDEVGFHISLPQPILACCMSRDNKYLAILMGSHADLEPEEILVFENLLADASASNCEEIAAGSISIDSMKIVSSILVQRSDIASGLLLSSTSFAIVSDSKLDLPIIVLSAALSPREAQADTFRPCLYVIPLESSDKFATNTKLKKISVEHDYPLLSIVHLDSYTILAAGVGAEILTLIFNDTWKSYSWGRPFRGAVQSILPSTQKSNTSAGEEFEDVFSLTMLPSFEGSNLLAGVLSSGGFAFWDVSSRELIGVKRDQEWAVSALYSLDLHSQAKYEIDDTMALDDLKNHLTPFMRSHNCFFLARIHSRHEKHENEWNGALAVGMMNREKNEIVLKPIDGGLKASCVGSSGSLNVIGCSNGDIWASNICHGIRYGPITLRQNFKTQPKDPITAILGFHDSALHGMYDRNQTESTISKKNKLNPVVITSLGGDCWIINGHSLLFPNSNQELM